MNTQETKSFSFWKKFSHKFIIFFSFLILAFAVQSAGLSAVTKQGPVETLAQDALSADSQFLDSQLQTGSGISSLSSITVSPSVTPVGGGVSDQHKCEDDLTYCDTNVNKMIHKTGGYWNGSICVYAFVPQGVCNQPAPQPAQPAPVQPAPQPAPVNNPIPCSQLVKTTTCGQPSYDTCTLHYEADGRARYDCVASQNPICVGSLYCGGTPTVNVPAPTSQLPACSSLATSSFCGQPAYDTCSYNSDGTVANCHASQNPNCVGTLTCNPSQPIFQPRPIVTPIINPVVTIPGVGGSNTNTNTNTSTSSNNNIITINNPAPIIIREVPVVQSQPIAIQVAAVDCPANTYKTVQSNQIVCIQNAPRVVVAGVAQTKELPKTGLPLLAWAAAAFVPMGAKIKRFNQGLSEKLAGDPNYLLEKRLYNIQSANV